MNMKMKPILFSGEMVRAIRAGTKTQTRRVALARAQNEADIIGSAIMEDLMSEMGDEKPVAELKAWNERIKCPYGEVGDHLWVREEHYAFGHWEEVPGVKTKKGRQKWKFVPTHRGCSFEPPSSFRKGRHHKDPYTKAWHKRLARFMPRAFSRIRLEVTGIRVERLNEISEADALAEGVTVGADAVFSAAITKGEQTAAQLEYWHLWETINGAGSWGLNPFVWVVEFKRVEGAAN